MSLALRDGVTRLEITTRVTLAILALASGVYTYIGVRELLNGNATLVFFAAVIYSVAVSVGIYAFWTYLMRFMPHVRERAGRGLLFGCMALGALMIIAMSAWLNASALAGAAAIQQHLAIAVQAYTRDLDRAQQQRDRRARPAARHPDGLGALRQFGRIRAHRLAHRHRRLRHRGAAADADVGAAHASRPAGHQTSADSVKALFEEGGKHVDKMRELVSDRGPIDDRSDAFGKEAMALMGVIAKLQQTSVAPAVKRAADGLVAGFIAPVADGRTADLAQRQTNVVGKVEAAVATQAKALSAATQQILDTPPVEPARFQPLSPAAAVIVYAADFLPSWAGAISIDLMPAVLVLILCVVHANIRRENEPAAVETMTAAQVLAALRIAREVEQNARPVAEVAEAAEAEPPLENVTALATARGKKE